MATNGSTNGSIYIYIYIYMYTCRYFPLDFFNMYITTVYHSCFLCSSDVDDNNRLPDVVNGKELKQQFLQIRIRGNRPSA